MYLSNIILCKRIYLFCNRICIFFKKVKILKKFLAVFICFTIMISFSACGKKNKDTTGGAKLRDIPTASAPSENGENAEGGEVENNEENNNDTNTPNGANSQGGERTSSSDRREIKNNLADARDLIENGYYDDAAMIISGLKTRDLRDSERRELEELQKMMLKVSD